MSQWDKRISDHAIWTELKTTGEAVDRALTRDGISAESIAGIERLRIILTLCGKRLASVDPILIDPRIPAGLNKHLVTARTELDAFVGDGNVEHISTANVHGDEILPILGDIPTPVDSEEITLINSAVTVFRKAVHDHLQATLAKQNEIDAAISTNSEKLASLTATVDREQQRLATLLTDYQTQFSSAQDKRASDFSTAHTDQQTKFAAAMSEQQSQFSSEQDSRKAAFGNSSLEYQEKFTQLISDYSQRLKDQESDFAKKADAQAKEHMDDLESLKSDYESKAAMLLVDIQQHKKDVEDLVGVIGNLGVTSGYLKVANHARVMQYLWQLLTVAALGGLIYVASLVAFPRERATPDIQLTQTQSPSEKVEAKAAPADPKKAEMIASLSSVVPKAKYEYEFLEGFASRLFLSIAFGIFAAYAARQASHFSETEQKNRKRALELEAFGPFIEPLDKADKDKFRLEIGERSFAVPDHGPHKLSETEPVTAPALVKEVTESIANLVKAVKS